MENSNIFSMLKCKGNLAFLYDNLTIRQGLEKIKAHKYTAIPVISAEGDYIGTVSEGDFLWYITENKADLNTLLSEPISKIIRRGFNPAAEIDVSFSELLLRAANQNFIPLVDSRNKFIGIITRRDIINYLKEHSDLA